MYQFLRNPHVQRRAGVQQEQALPPGIQQQYHNPPFHNTQHNQHNQHNQQQYPQMQRLQQQQQQQFAMYRKPEVCCPSIFLNFKLMCGVANAIFTGTTEHVVTWRAYAFITPNWQRSFVSGFQISALASPCTFTTGWPHTYRRLEPEELDTINCIQMIQTESWPRRNHQWWVVDYPLLIPLFLESAQVFISNHGGYEDCTLAGKLRWHGCCIGAVGFEW
jgi:hypothetical protein